MTGGLLQLIAYGSQDLYLTGNPTITFFKKFIGDILIFQQNILISLYLYYLLLLQLKIIKFPQK